MKKLDRREFLKLGGISLAALLMPQRPLPWEMSWAMRAPYGFHSPPTTLGRVALGWGQAVRAEPNPRAERTDYKRFNDVIPLQAQVEGEPPWPSNPIWYKTEGGYIHSAYVQPVRNEPQGAAVTEVSEPGFWAEVSVPIAEARWRPGSAYVARRLYYGTVYRVVSAVQDEEGGWWYQLLEGITYSPGPYVPASTLRYIHPGELAPISVGHPDKWIHIDLSTHMLTCYEGGTGVFSTVFASGLPDTRTPLGEFPVLYKRKTRRMMGGEGDDEYDLPGVPFPTYFTWSGVAIHGTYWHNDYGRAKSHGCVNVPSEAAKWIYRWVEPVSAYDVYTQKADPETDPGTRVVVSYGPPEA